MSTDPKKTLLVLDFDGVICDSAPENAATAWHVACHLWPHEFTVPEVPQEISDCFCRIARPYLETGWQSILQLHLIKTGQPAAHYTTEFQSSLKAILLRLGLSKEELKRLFGAERDRWLKDDRQGWLACNHFYSGTGPLLAQLKSTYGRVVILTTKEDRFVAELFKREEIDFDRDDIYGLERIKSKDESLKAFLSDNRYSSVCFVEDRLDTLQRIHAVPGLEAIRLYFATWGYATREQQQSARETDYITCLHSLALPEL